MFHSHLWEVNDDRHLHNLIYIYGHNALQACVHLLDDLDIPFYNSIHINVLEYFVMDLNNLSKRRREEEEIQTLVDCLASENVSLKHTNSHAATAADTKMQECQQAARQNAISRSEKNQRNLTLLITYSTCTLHHAPSLPSMS